MCQSCQGHILTARGAPSSLEKESKLTIILNIYTPPWSNTPQGQPGAVTFLLPATLIHVGYSWFCPASLVIAVSQSPNMKQLPTEAVSEVTPLE